MKTEQEIRDEIQNLYTQAASFPMNAPELYAHLFQRIEALEWILND